MEIYTEVCVCGNYESYFAIMLRMFGDDDFEIKDADDDAFICRHCGNVVHRFHGFMTAFKKLNDVDFIAEATSELDGDLKSVVTAMLQRVRVPSFAADVTDFGFSQADKLRISRTGLFSFTKATGAVALEFAIADVERLGVFEYGDILDTLNLYRESHLNGASLARVHAERRNKRVNALPNDFSAKDKASLIERFEGKCALTGREVPIQIDHVIPVSIGHGGTFNGNMLPVWQRINSSKGNRNLFEWYADNGERFGVVPELFEQSVAYLAELNGMTADEYRDYVYDCHANPNDILTEV